MQIYLNNGFGREEMIIQIICYIYCPVNKQKTELLNTLQQISNTHYNGHILKLSGTVLKTKSKY